MPYKFSNIRPISQAIIFLAVLGVSAELHAAPLTNGDFSTGFLGWSGQVTDVNLATTTSADPTADFPDNYSISIGARLVTTTTTDGIFSVLLFQAFDLPTITAGQSLMLTADFSAIRSDPTRDVVFAQIEIGGSGAVVPFSLSSLVALDLTAFAGRQAEILFGIEDFDDLQDSMIIRSVRLAVVGVPDIPIPAAWILFAPVAAGVLRLRQRNSRPLARAA